MNTDKHGAAQPQPKTWRFFASLRLRGEEVAKSQKIAKKATWRALRVHNEVEMIGRPRHGSRLAICLSLISCLYAMDQIPPTIARPPKSPQAAPGVYYTDITASAGIAFRHVSGTPLKNYIIETPGSGSAFLDYDNDGWLDIYIVNGSTYRAIEGKEPSPRAALFRNNRDGTFTDVTARAGVSNDRWGQGVCVGDYDNDGWPDIFVTNYGKNRLYRNNGSHRRRSFLCRRSQLLSVPRQARHVRSAGAPGGRGPSVPQQWGWNFHGRE